MSAAKFGPTTSSKRRQGPCFQQSRLCLRQFGGVPMYKKVCIRTYYIEHQFTQNKRTWCQSILSLFVTLFAPTIFTSGSKEFYCKGSMSILDQELIFWTSKLEPADKSRIFYKLPYLCRQTPRRPWSSFRWISPHRPQGQGR